MPGREQIKTIFFGEEKNETWVDKNQIVNLIEIEKIEWNGDKNKLRWEYYEGAFSFLSFLSYSFCSSLLFNISLLFFHIVFLFNFPSSIVLFFFAILYFLSYLSFLFPSFLVPFSLLFNISFIRPAFFPIVFLFGFHYFLCSSFYRRISLCPSISCTHIFSFQSFLLFFLIPETLWNLLMPFLRKSCDVSRKISLSLFPLLGIDTLEQKNNFQLIFFFSFFRVMKIFQVIYLLLAINVTMWNAFCNTRCIRCGRMENQFQISCMSHSQGPIVEDS